MKFRTMEPGLPSLSVATEWVAHEALRGNVANSTPLGDARLSKKHGD